MKTCPCCGGKPGLSTLNFPRVRCMDCGLSTNMTKTDAEAIDLWDKRVPTAPLEEVAGLVPLVLYFGSREDADGFVAAVEEAKPGMIKRRV